MFFFYLSISHSFDHIIFFQRKLRISLTKNKVSLAPFCNEHAVIDIFLIDPKAWVLYEFFLLFAVILVLRHVPKIIILIVLIVFILVSFLVRLLFVIIVSLSFYHCPIYHEVMVFGLGQLKLKFLDLLDVVFFFGMLFKDFMVLIFDDFLHFELFFLEFLVFGVDIDDGSFEGWIK